MKTISELLGHSTVSFTADRYTSVTDEVGFAAAESLAATVPRAVPAWCPPWDESDTGADRGEGICAGQGRWGGWGSNPGPTDYEIVPSHFLTSEDALK
jgi:hypothetical protein